MYYFTLPLDIPLENINLENLFSGINDNNVRKTLLIVIAENIDTMTPIPSVKAKPLISAVPNQKRIMAVIMVEELESRIEDQARVNPDDTASPMFLPA